MTKFATMKNNKLEQYKGFINTPNLWKDNVVKNLYQFDLPTEYFEILDFETFNEIRLGKRVEQFFNFQIEKSSEYGMLVNNLQINKEKLTIGELDALIQTKTQQLHIEIIYKFYLYDPNIKSENELDKWIGPNRKDTLVYKLNKLKEKQLPLLYSKHTKTVLESFNLNVKNITQKVCYKAQLFIPFQPYEATTSLLNKACIYGFYLNFDKIEMLCNNKIFIPKKLDWLIQPHTNVDWLNFENGKAEIYKCIVQNRSPMIWLKSNNNTFQKCFITFW